VIVPAGTTNAPITVSTGDAFSTSSQMFYVPAAIVSIAPSNSPAGSMITIKGNNFSGALGMSFNGTPTSSFVVSNNATIGAVVPPGVLTAR
jgi:hypothetical protein